MIEITQKVRLDQSNRCTYWYAVSLTTPSGTYTAEGELMLQVLKKVGALAGLQPEEQRELQNLVLELLPPA